MTLWSTVSHGIHIITVRESYAFVNQTKQDFYAQLITVPLGKAKATISYDEDHQVELPNHAKTETESQPLMLWQLISVDQSEFRSDDNVEYVQYLTLKHCDMTLVEGVDEEDLWSYPLRVRTKTAVGERCSVVVPCWSGFGDLETRSYTATLHTQAGVSYMVMTDEPAPSMVLHNNCGFPLCYGQSVMNLALGGETWASTYLIS